MPKFNVSPGINHVGAYQVSGQPFASGSINAASAVKISFPFVTRWVIIANHATDQVCRVGFSELGVAGESEDAFFRVPPKVTTANDKDMFHQTNRLEFKVSEIWLSGSNNVDVYAGLTKIPASSTSTDKGTNWSGSAGVG